MQNPLIFTERGWLPRLVDLLLTLMAWGGFIWLFAAGLLKIIYNTPFAGPRPLASGLNTLTLYVGIGLFNALVLIGWAKYNQLRFRTERRRRRPGLQPQELAQSLSISARDVSVLNGSDVLRVHHDDGGQIARVEALSGR